MPRKHAPKKPAPAPPPPQPKRKIGRPSKRILEPELVAAALVELSGNYAAVARRFNVTRHAVEKVVANSEHLQQVAYDCRQGMLDNAESALFKAVLAGEAWAVCFFLKTQGKKRGYIEKQQVELGDMNPTEIIEEVIATRQAAAGEGATDSAASSVR